MALFRTLYSLLVVALLTASLFGAGLAAAADAHGHGETQFEQGLPTESTGSMDECCQDASDRGASCMSVLGMAPDASEPCLAAQFHKAIAVRPVGLSDGRDPHDLLDPPRTA
ncbi:hypothetical protein MWU52_01270 [Jannaschia sp. S6380]|uniref:hypothetical protein n=1 Tax=Jannaschia sp. S6380 TaxID=2926408 RepID=UPI001FF2406D|nr:hypothetical protein [Jannaschia sp. S6380]MCK0166174.1 hypothetical protein [Jannaschia sp. S6380]